jgi:hypothetical protein
LIQKNSSHFRFKPLFRDGVRSMVTPILRYNAGPRDQRAVLKTEVFNALEALHCEDIILPNHSRYEKQI